MPEPSPKTLESYRDAKSWFVQEMKGSYEQTELESMFRYIVAEVTTIPFNKVRVSLNERPAEEFGRALYRITHRLLQGEPLQYVLNKAYFCDLALELDQHVLIPRPETEELVYLIQQVLGTDFTGKIIDIGSGSGCITLALQCLLPKAVVTGIDKSATAVAVAKRNAKRLDMPVHFQIKAVELLAMDGLDVVVSNPPYIGLDEAETMDNHVTGFEPNEALFVSGNDPLYFYRLIANKVADCSQVKHVFLEVNPRYADETIALFQGSFESTQMHLDINGKKRMIHAQR